MNAPVALANLAIANFADVPKYSRLLSAGDQAFIELDRAAAEMLVVVDLGEMQAAILAVADAPFMTMMAIEAGKRTAKAKLRERGYSEPHEYVVTKGVVAEVLRNPGIATESAGQGEPIALFRRWVSAAIKQLASDIHIEFDDHQARIRVRVDGVLVPLADGSGGRYSRAAALDAVAAGYNTTRVGNSSSDYDPAKHRDCIVKFNDGGECDLRYQSMPGRHGPKVVMRIQRLSDRRTQGTFETAGYTPSQQRMWAKAARIGKGLVVITGAVNSGKSSSLQTFMESLPDRESQALYTVEDPIERKIEGTHQMEVVRDAANEKITQDRYAAAIRGLLRGDMDVVMLGEVRDWLTANFFLQVGQTGHLALGTLHAHFLSSIVARLTNERMGLTREELTSPKVLNLLVYQSLLPQLCGACRVKAQVAAKSDGEVADMLGLLGSKFKLDPARFFIKSKHGCEHCGGRGTFGRVVVAEMFQPDRTWLDLTRQGDDYGAQLHYRSLSDGDFTSSDMTGKTVFEHALLRAWHGQVDVRACEEFESFDRFELLAQEGRA